MSIDRGALRCKNARNLLNSDANAYALFTTERDSSRERDNSRYCNSETRSRKYNLTGAKTPNNFK